MTITEILIAGLADSARASASAEIRVVGEDPGSLAAMDAEIRRMAKKQGVPDDRIEVALMEFAQMLVPHAGREPSRHRLSHWKLWWKGYAAGLRAK
jgi:hypothetical protein